MTIPLTFTEGDFSSWFDARRDDVARSLMDYIAIDTVSPGEAAAEPFLRDYLATVGAELTFLPFSPGLEQHWSFSPHGSSDPTPQRGSWRAVLGAGASDTRTLFNAHVDVVPASPDFPSAFDPVWIDDRIIGRGACDTKNNLVMLVEAIRFLQDAGIPLQRTPILDLPAEEEIGGNGTLSLITNAPPVDEAICLEPTSLAVMRGHRGCLSFRVDVTGRSVHMGSGSTGMDAIAGGIEVIDALRRLERQLLSEAVNEPGFAHLSSPLQLNVGIIEGGEWSGSVPERCHLVADLGFLPSTSLTEVEARILEACRSIPNRWMADRLAVRFDVGLRNDAYLTSGEAPVVADLSAAARAAGYPVRAEGWHVSCDARLYQKVLGVPTAIFGSGSLANAHSPHEEVSLHEIREGTNILARFLSAPTSRDE